MHTISAYEKGRRAGLNGLRACVNPFHPYRNTLSHRQWAKGYHEGILTNRLVVHQEFKLHQRDPEKLRQLGYFI